MKFNTPKFNDELNLTVRRGTKWGNLKGKFYLGDIDSEAVQVGKVKQIKVMKFEDIRGEDLTLEHDPECREYDGLIDVMRGIYDDFDTYEIVTLVFFELIE